MTSYPIATWILLCEIAREPGYGLSLMDRIQMETHGMTFHQGTIYPLLRELEAEGILVVSYSEPMAVRGGRRRYIYALTEEGWRVVTEMRKQLNGLVKESP